jgi:hypothetical protein
VSLVLVPCTLAQANSYVEQHHRHHRPVTASRFALAIADECGLVRGVAIVGLPVARAYCPPADSYTAEVRRVCTDGCKNGCSMLYAAAWRAARAIGYKRLITYGGGVQSVAALVLAAQGVIDYRDFVFCNVGVDSENPRTLTYYRDNALPFALAHDLTMTELQYIRRDGTTDTILKRLTRPEGRSIGIPVRMSNGAPGRRACTVDFKIRRTDCWLRQQGAKKRGAIVGMGISLDEFQRMKTNTDPKTLSWKTLDYPLIDLRLDRAACIRIIQAAGLPVPPKSACWFCPFHSIAAWQEMRQDDPELFARATDLEAFLIQKRTKLGRYPAYFTAKGKPLPMAISEHAQPSLFEDEVCESGYCFV